MQNIITVTYREEKNEMPTELENMVAAHHAEIQFLKERLLIIEQRDIEQAKKERDTNE